MEQDRIAVYETAIRKGQQAREALVAVEPVFVDVEAELFRLWKAEGDPERREETWRLMRGIDAARAHLRKRVATGQQAADELLHLSTLKGETP